VTNKPVDYTKPWMKPDSSLPPVIEYLMWKKDTTPKEMKAKGSAPRRGGARGRRVCRAGSFVPPKAACTLAGG